jgi:hypothetical protein
MLVTSPHAILAIHFNKGLGPVNRYDCASVTGPKIGRRQLEQLGLLHHAIDATALFLTDTHPAHEVGQPFIARLISVDEPLTRYPPLSFAMATLGRQLLAIETILASLNSRFLVLRWRLSP